MENKASVVNACRWKLRHRWLNWSDVVKTTSTSPVSGTQWWYQFRECERCGLIERRQL